MCCYKHFIFAKQKWTFYTPSFTQNTEFIWNLLLVFVYELENEKQCIDKTKTKGNVTAETYKICMHIPPLPIFRSISSNIDNFNL